MADTATAAAPVAAAAPPKRKPLTLLLVVAAFAGGAAAGGAGAGIALASLGGMAGKGHAEAPEPAAPKKLDYVELDTAFTSNLSDTGRYLQLRLAVSTTGGEAVVAALAQHKPAIVSAVIAVLGDLGEADISGAPAKARLKTKLRAAIDEVLRQKANLRGIDEVFLTSLVVQ